MDAAFGASDRGFRERTPTKQWSAAVDVRRRWAGVIGTVICRNCDTAIEVSEGDVTRFRASPVFRCTTCGDDLSQRVGEMIGRVPTPDGGASEEPAGPDEDVFEGLPLGESFDTAAQRLRDGRPSDSDEGDDAEEMPALRIPERTPVVQDPTAQDEDPLSLALRIATQAQALAAQVAGEDEAPTGVLQIVRDAPTPQGPPDDAATEPGAPAPTNIAAPSLAEGTPSTEVGVVPEEPENEPTVRRGESNGADAHDGSVTEPTLPSDEEGTPFEHTPLLGAEEAPNAVFPEAPANERTPALAAADASPFVQEPPREVTIRKATAPRPVRASVSASASALRPRTGTGPLGFGALGFRVAVPRAVVRPDGGAIVPPPLETTRASVDRTGGDRVSIERVVLDRQTPDRPSGEARAVSARTPERTPVAAAPAAALTASTQPRPAAPAAAVSGSQSDDFAPRRPNPGGFPRWAMLGIGGVVVLVAGTITAVRLGTGGAPRPTPMPTPTPMVETSATVEAPTPTGEALAFPTASPAATPASDPTPVARSSPQPSPTPKARATGTQVAAVSSPRPAASPVATPFNAARLVDELKRVAETDPRGALDRLTYAAAQPIDRADRMYLYYHGWVIAGRHGQPDAARTFAELYVKHFPDGSEASTLRDYIARVKRRDGGR